MKKLMLGFAASAALAATSAYADDEYATLNDTVGFETVEGYTAETGVGSVAKWLYQGSTTDGSLVKAYSGDAPEGAGTQYLNLKTDGGTLWRSLNDLTEGDTPALGEAFEIGNTEEGKVYVDTLVQFTYSEDAPDVESPNKLAVWWGSNGDETKTNLYVTSVQYIDDDSGVLDGFTVHHFCITNVNVEEGSWHRLTVKAAVGGIVTGMDTTAYQVYLDETLCVASECAVPTKYVDSQGANVKKQWRSLTYFPAIDASESLQAVGFQGQGKVDNLTVTTTRPDFIPEELTMTFTITWDAHVASIYAMGKESGEFSFEEDAFNDAGSATFDMIEDETIEICYAGDTTYEDGWMPGVWTWENAAEGDPRDDENGTYTFTAVAGLTVHAVSTQKTNIDFTLTVPSGSSVVSLKLGDEPVTYDSGTGVYTLPIADKADLTLTLEAGEGKLFANGQKTITVTIPTARLTDGAIDVTDLVDQEIKDVVVKINGTDEYLTFAAAFAVAQDDDTITLLDDATTDVIKTFKNNLTIDLGGKTLTANLAADSKYIFQILKDLNVTFTNGNIAVAEPKTSLTTVFQNYANLTVADVEIDAANLTGSNAYWDRAAVFAIMNGNVAITGSTSIKNNSGYAISIGNHAGGDYLSRAVAIDTTGTLGGDFLFAGGTVTYTKGGFADDAKYYYGGAMSVAPTVFAGSDLVNFPLVAGVGEAPSIPETAATYKVCGQLYTTIEAAVEVAEAGQTVTLVKDCAIDGEKAVTLGSNKAGLYITKDLTIDAAGDYTLTGPSGAYGIVVGGGATLTLKGGTFKELSTESRSIVNVGNPANGDFGADAFTGNLVLDGATIKGAGAATKAGNAIAAANGTVTITSGTVTDIGARGVKAEGTATITINGGTIESNDGVQGTVKPALYVKESGSITVNGGWITGVLLNDATTTATLTIPGSSTARFDREDSSGYCESGFKLVVDEEITGGTWYKVVADIPDSPWTEPAEDTDEARAAALENDGLTADQAAEVKDATEYAAFKAYVDVLTAEATTKGIAGLTEAQKAHVTQSYFLGTAALLEADPVITVEDLGESATAGAWDFEVKITAGGADVAAAIANVAKLVKCGTSLKALGTPGTAEANDYGQLNTQQKSETTYKFTATPPANAQSFFFTIKK